jgi:hypothetical protein
VSILSCILKEKIMGDLVDSAESRQKTILLTAMGLVVTRPQGTFETTADALVLATAIVDAEVYNDYSR